MSPRGQPGPSAKPGKETGDDRTPALAPACRARPLHHCWLPPLGWASFAPAMEHIKRKHALSPYGKGQGVGGEQVPAQEIPEWQQKWLSSTVCSWPSCLPCGRTRKPLQSPLSPKVLPTKDNLRLLNPQSKAGEVTAGPAPSTLLPLSELQAKTTAWPLTSPSPSFSQSFITF